MKNRLLAVCMALFLVLTLFGQSMSVFAVTDPVDEFARQMLDAVQKGQIQASFRVNGGEVSDRAFQKYPILVHYYDSLSYTKYTDYTDFDVVLKNTQDAVEDIPVITTEDEMYALICTGLSCLQTELKFVTANGFIPTDECMDRITSDMRINYPLSYMGYHGWSSQYTYLDEIGVRDYRLTFNWFYDLELSTLRQWRNETVQATLNIAETLFAQDMSDSLKILLIHDYLVNNNRYNTENLDQPGNHLSYGALVRGSCVCQGYSEACLVLCQAAGLDAVYVPGDGINSEGVPESHGWNAVKLDGQWYMIDITWDDPVSKEDILQYDYFLVTSQMLREDHVWEEEKYPLCTATFHTADSVRNEAANDQRTYVQYTNTLVVTPEEAEAHFRPVLESCKAKLPGQGDAGNTDVVTTEPINPGIVTTDPVNPGVIPTNPVNPVTPSETPSNQQRSGNEDWFLVLFPVAGAVVAVILTIKKTNNKKKSKKRVPPVRPFSSDFDDWDKPNNFGW